MKSISADDSAFLDGLGSRACKRLCDLLRADLGEVDCAFVVVCI